MTTLRRRHLLATLPWLSLSAGPLHAQDVPRMTASPADAADSEVQVGAGTDAGVTSGSSGPQNNKNGKKTAAPTPPRKPDGAGR